MATYTTNLGLRKPTRTAGNDDIVDVASDVNENMDTLDLNVNFRVATSSSRPSTPRTGMMIFETDTGLVMLWDGSQWRSYGAPDQPKGKSSMTTSQAVGASLTSASSETLYMSTTWTREANRRYVVEWGVHTECVSTSDVGTMGGRLRLASGGSVTNTDTFLGSASLNFGNPSGTGTSNTEFYSGHFTLTNSASGTHTVGLFGIVFNAGDTMRYTGASNKTNWISVRDIGAI